MSPQDWQPDPDAPTSRQRNSAGETRPTGYVTQPAGPEPAQEVPRDGTTELYGAAPAPVGGAPAARRRLRAGVVLVVVAATVAVVVLILGFAGVF